MERLDSEQNDTLGLLVAGLSVAAFGLVLCGSMLASSWLMKPGNGDAWGAWAVQGAAEWWLVALGVASSYVGPLVPISLSVVLYRLLGQPRRDSTEGWLSILMHGINISALAVWLLGVGLYASGVFH